MKTALRHSTENHFMFKQMINQQQDQQKQLHDMQSLLMLHQQQQTTAVMKIIETLVPK